MEYVHPFLQTMNLNFLLFVSFLMNNGGQAIPVSSTAESSPLAKLHSSSNRSLAGIVSGCLVTTFLCAWVAVHPNIPPEGECGWKAVWRRTKLMFWTLLAPELILAWAVNQRHAAQEIADTYNEIKGLKPEERSYMAEWLEGHRRPRSKELQAWTRIHGHFLIMGGFVLTEPDSPTENGHAGNDPNSDPIAQLADNLHIASESDTFQLSYHNSSTLDHENIAQLSDIQHPSLAKARQRHRGSAGCGPRYLYPEPYVAQPITISHCDHSKHWHLYSPQISSTVPPITAQANALPRSPGQDPNPQILTYEMLEKLLKINGLDFEISITEEEIQDRSKGDFLAKLVAGLQVFWFIVQCLARLAQRLDLTQLELVTLALASLNAVMYGFWIDKPLNVKVPVIINLKRRLTDEEREGGEPDAKKPLFQFLIDQCVLTQEVRQDVWHTILKFVRNIPSQHPLAIRNSRCLYHWFLVLPFRAVLFLVGLAMLSPFIHLSISLFCIVFTNTIPIEALHVPTFYCPRTNKVSRLHFVVLLIGGFIFSCLHHLGPCLTTFPNVLEQELWVAMSYYMMAGLLLSASIAYFLSILQIKLQGSGTVVRILYGFLVWLVLYALFLGIYGRLKLIILALVLLRQQPDRVFCAVDWTKFIPHILD